MATLAVILLNGTTADANEVMSDFYPLYQDIDPSNVQSANKTGSGPFVLRDGATINTPTISTPTITNPTITGGTATNVTLVNPIISTGSPFTQGSVLFAGAAGVITEDNANLFWDNGTNRLGIGTATPATTLHINNAGGNAQTRLTGAAAGNHAFQVGATNGAAFGWDDTSNEIFIHYDAPLGSGSVNAARFRTNGELLMQAIDPPTANYANRNSFVKAWGLVRDNGTILASYNLSSVGHVGGSGFYTLVWDTNFASSNYALVVSQYNFGALIVNPSFVQVETQGASNAVVQTFNDAGVSADFGFSFIAIGDQ